jgi:hypothetical protein
MRSKPCNFVNTMYREVYGQSSHGEIKRSDFLHTVLVSLGIGIPWVGTIDALNFPPGMTWEHSAAISFEEILLTRRRSVAPNMRSYDAKQVLDMGLQRRFKRCRIVYSRLDL